jgi:hypothetical protein
MVDARIHRAAAPHEPAVLRGAATASIATQAFSTSDWV